MSHDSDPVLSWCQVQLRKAELITDDLARLFRRQATPENLKRLNRARAIEGRIKDRRDEYIRKFNLTNGV